MQHTFSITTKATLLFLGMVATGNSFSIENDSGYQTLANTSDRIIVKYKSTIHSSKMKSMSGSFALTPMEEATPVKRTSDGAHIFKLSSQKTLEELQGIIAEIKQSSQVEYAEPDLILHPSFTPDDSRYNEQWHYFDETAGIQLPQAWDSTQGNSAVVAILDTGYRPHKDLVANILPGYDMVSDLFMANDGDARDSDAMDPGTYAAECNSYRSSWHGTHIAGTVAAIGNNQVGVTGVAFQAKLLPVRVLGRCGGYMSDIADGIAWAAGLSIPGIEDNQNPANVINLSLGATFIGCPKTLNRAINVARQQGATIVTAAGNGSKNASMTTPANCDGVIAVAASNHEASRASFSNYGSLVDVSAPGVDILSTHNSGHVSPGYDTYSSAKGTSMAAPHVSGVAALLYALKPDITPDEVKQIITMTARPFPNRCIGCGSGIVDAAAAVAAIKEDTNNITGLTQLYNATPITGLAADTNQALKFFIDVPEGADTLSFDISGGIGDADLYIQYAEEPTQTAYLCRSYQNGNAEHCTIKSIKEGRYYVMVDAYAAFLNATLVANYTIIENDPDRNFQNLKDYPIPDFAFSGVTSPIDVSRSGASGEVDLIVIIKHPYIREVTVELIDPEGGVHNLKGLEGYGEDLVEHYSLQLGDIPSEGRWLLRVKDFGSHGNGYIDSWRMVFP
jgi:serine protease